MELRDLLVTPIVILVVYILAHLARPYVTDSVTRAYFFPALTLRIVCSISLGLLYQFYYKGGDTFNYHTLGSRIVWEAFIREPIAGVKLIFGELNPGSGLYEYTSRILFVRDPNSYFLVRIAAFFDLFTFSSYSGTAVLFAAVSFSGAWAFFLTFYKKIPSLHFQLSLGVLFIPSVVFWGSGILKDTIVVAAIGFATHYIDLLFIQKKRRLRYFIFLLISLFVILEVRKFILQAFIPAAILWIYIQRLMSIKSLVVRALIFPLLFIFITYGAYWAVVKVGEGDSRYAIDKITTTAQITAYDIGFFTGKDAGSRYSLGELDGTFSDMLSKAPAAINVSLFRPYLWEIRSPLMLFSAFESFLFTILLGYILMSKNTRIFSTLKRPDIIFTVTVSIILAFAVGITSYNFGTLSRYKIQFLPFFAVAMILITHYSKRERKFDEFDSTEYRS